MAWIPPTLMDLLATVEAARVVRQRAKLARRVAKLAGNSLIARDLATGTPLDPDFIDEPAVDLLAPVTCSGFSLGKRFGRCGRRVVPERMFLVANVPAAIIGSATYLCDGCCETLHREGLVPHSTRYELAGAPPAMVAAWRATEAAVTAARRQLHGR